MIGIPNPKANLSLMVICLSSSLGASKELVGVAMRIGTVLELLLVVCAGTVAGALVTEEVAAALVVAIDEIVLVSSVDDSAADAEDDTAALRPPDSVNTEEKSFIVP